MDITGVGLGQEFTIKAIHDKGNPVVRKLYAMGLKEGSKARLLLKNGRVYLLRVNNSRVIIDSDIARSLEVA